MTELSTPPDPSTPPPTDPTAPPPAPDPQPGGTSPEPQTQQQSVERREIVIDETETDTVTPA